ncbi:methionyl-tRNA formyltransferase, mitochondrial-like [Mizuhopecten yessoensis]|uniref:Methionyl-tRNA formyltransferase, mitochondrial n=1 Tax=Mizuhopecten yessoensis TaxID=6573 RepID=A0A210QLL5_MIZYE|nr:methionyl-tRNA formyltransferase, mitochondrial-like [Mizuhopecten yessoensis]OWF49625.1 Methionyl-tRNA formyltransferase, mitochondrial [Mizuhopecten yessoensis]
MMSISLKKLGCTSVIKSICRCPRGQMTQDFPRLKHNSASQSTHLYQPNALLKMQQCHKIQTFRSSSSYLQSAFILQRRYLRQNSISKGRQSSVFIPSVCCSGRARGPQLKPSSLLFPVSAVCAFSNGNSSRLTYKTTSFSTSLSQRQSFQVKPSLLISQTSPLSTSVCYSNTKEFTNVRMCPPWRVLFFGSDTFSLVALKALNENMLQTESESKVVESLEVVCPAARTPVKRYSEEIGLTVHEWPVKVDREKFDVGVLVSFGKLIPGRIINAFPHGIINIHPSLLPRWRGAAPISHTILNGDTHAGVSIMELRPKHFDIGPILLQETLSVPERCSSSQLADLLAVLGVKLMLAALCDLPTLERLEIEQSSSGVTYAPKITPGMDLVDWENSTVCDIDRQYRGIIAIMPLRSKYDGEQVKLYDMIPINAIPDDVIDERVQRLYKVTSSTMVPPGRTLFLKHQQCVLIKCKDGWVGFQRMRMNKKMTAQAFFNKLLTLPGSEHKYFESQTNTLQTDTDSDIPTATRVQN